MDPFTVIATAGFLTLAADPVQCRVPAAPVVEIVPGTSPTAFDNTKTVADLNGMKSDTISPYGNNVEQLVYGLHHGQMSIGYSIEFGGMEYPGYGVSCLHFNKVKVTLDLNPVIFVAMEFRPGTCEYGAVVTHEKKHVAADRRIVNKYAREIGLAVQDAVNRAGAVGPYRTAEIASIRQRMSAHIGSVVKSVEFNMLEEQARLQQAVDSMDEYDSVSRQIHETCGCRGANALGGRVSTRR